MADRRRRLWTSQNAEVTLSTGGVAGQIALGLDTDFIASTGLASMFGCTVVRTFLRGYIRSGDSTVSDMAAFIGLGVFPNGIDQGDYPDLNVREGDWFGYLALPFLTSGVAVKPVQPEEAAYFTAEFRSARKIGLGETLTLVIQQTITRSVVYHVTTTMLCLLP